MTEKTHEQKLIDLGGGVEGGRDSKQLEGDFFKGLVTSPTNPASVM